MSRKKENNRPHQRRKRLRRYHESLHELFRHLKEYRDARRIRYALADLVSLFLIGIILGARDCVTMTKMLQLNRHRLRRLFGYQGDIPSHDTFNDMLNRLDWRELNDCLMYHADLVAGERMEDMHSIRVDGKALRAATDRAGGGKTPYVLNAFATELNLVIGVYRIPDKNNEISMLPLILEKLDISGRLVTCDAIACQKDIFRLITQMGGICCIPTKGNQKNLCEEAAFYINTAINDGDCQSFKTLDIDHGIERRKYFISTLAPDESIPDWPFVKAVGRVDRHRERPEGGRMQVSDETVYYICNAPMNVEEFSNGARAHWSIEGSHNREDEVLRADRWRCHKDNAVGNVALFNRFAYNLFAVELERDSSLTLKDLGWRFAFSPERVIRLVVRPFWILAG